MDRALRHALHGIAELVRELGQGANQRSVSVAAALPDRRPGLCDDPVGVRQIGGFEDHSAVGLERRNLRCPACRQRGLKLSARRASPMTEVHGAVEDDEEISHSPRLQVGTDRVTHIVNIRVRLHSDMQVHRDPMRRTRCSAR